MIWIVGIGLVIMGIAAVYDFWKFHKELNKKIAEREAELKVLERIHKADHLFKQKQYDRMTNGERFIRDYEAKMKPKETGNTKFLESLRSLNSNDSKEN